LPRLPGRAGGAALHGSLAHGGGGADDGARVRDAGRAAHVHAHADLLTGARPARRPPWWAAVFTLALLLRLAYVLLAPEPIRFSDQYFYVNGALRIAGDPHPLRLIATSDEGRLWGGRRTNPPRDYTCARGGCRLTPATA